MIKILNLYAGIGGNRKFWDTLGIDIHVTAVENNLDVAAIYKDFYPDDDVIIDDAHQYLLKNYKEFNFIWASPPCQTHSRLVNSNEKMFYKKQTMNYPDMKLYEEIILLKSFAPKHTKWVVENVKPYYEYLIQPTIILNRHSFWNNFKIDYFSFNNNHKHMSIESNSCVYEVNLSKYSNKAVHKRQMLRNMVNPQVGNYILTCALKDVGVDYRQGSLFDENNM